MILLKTGATYLVKQRRQSFGGTPDYEYFGNIRLKSCTFRDLFRFRNRFNRIPLSRYPITESERNPSELGIDKIAFWKISWFPRNSQSHSHLEIDIS